MKRLILLFFSTGVLIALLPVGAISQCYIVLDSASYYGNSYFNPDTVNICLGETVSFYATGGCPTYLMANDFNDQTVGNGWSSNASPMFNNPCGVGSDGTTYLWIGPAANFPRELVTNPFIVTTQCQICFDMKYATQSVSSPCEGPDEPTEGVHLQWSYNVGGPWLDINYWDPVGGYDPYLTTWHQYCENVPVSGTLYFRWYQTNTSGNDYDHWGLDNVQIFCPPINQTVEITDNFGNTINTGQWSATVTPTQTTTYYVTVSDGALSATDSLVVTVYPPPVLQITGLATGYCSTDPAVTLTGSPTPGDFSGTGIVPPHSIPQLQEQVLILLHIIIIMLLRILLQEFLQFSMTILRPTKDGQGMEVVAGQELLLLPAQVARGGRILLPTILLQRIILSSAIISEHVIPIVWPRHTG